MYQRLAPIILSSALISMNLEAWGTTSNPRTPPEKTQEPAKPVQAPTLKLQEPVQIVREKPEKPVPEDDRYGLLQVDYLFWKPYQEDLSFVLDATVTPGTDTLLNIKYRTKSPHFHLSSGVRVALGGYTCDKWDVKLQGTYLPSHSTKHVKASSDSLNGLYPSFFPITAGEDGAEASAHWQLYFGLMDLTLGREAGLTKKFFIHPFIGIRGAWIYERMKGFFEGNLPIDSDYKYTNQVWGIGPRAGMNSRYYFAKNWSFQGGLSGSFILGNFSANQRLIHGVVNEFADVVIKTTLKDKQQLIRANLDASLGLGWDMWFNRNKNRVYIALLCETSYWFGINQLMDLNLSEVDFGPPASVQASVVADKRHGDLAFFGGTLHFQLDF